jgi:hypothetical protein
MITKELLNKNRVLTMSNNRKCDYLIVDVSATTGSNKDITTMMAINTQGDRKDILVIKTFIGKSFMELVNEAYWLCNEFYIKIVLVDKLGLGLEFIEQFKNQINPNNISIRSLDGRKINQFIDIQQIQNDLQYGNLRFLQSSELALTSYLKPFLGFSNIMNSHRETDELINEISNIKINVEKVVKLSRIDKNIGKSRVNCLLGFYSYPMSCDSELENDILKDKEKYYITKRISQYEIIHGIFYKYIFKCIENDGIKVLFYHNGRHKIKQFQNITQEDDFRKLFSKNIKHISISKDYFELIFFNGSSIKFVFGGESSRGSKCHYAIVDSEIEKDFYYSVIIPTCVLFDMDKEDMRLKDNYCIETVDM